ncbi:MAG TPA: type IX secretion system membrane protein PorP/SprF [Bacteroidia bacterium]|jgi:hypothetical protein|nr:type IX secretion system membrane protein PorP/SprF [Bacteroidia bacterium]
MKNHFLRAFILLSVYSSAQPDFSNAFFNKMNMNPAYTGVKDISAPDTLEHKQVDVFYNNTPKSSDYVMATFHMPIYTIHSGIGVMLNYNNEVSEFSEYAAKMFYRYTLVPGLYVGASAGFVNIKLRYYDPTSIGSSSQRFTSPDVDLGIVGQTGSVFFGLALGHINTPVYTISGYPENIPFYTGMTYNSTFGCNINISETRLCMMACFYNNDLSAHLLFYPCKYFFIGLSSTVYYDGAHEVPLISQDIKRDDYSIAFTAGLSLFNNQLNISLSIIKYPGLYNGNYPNSESLLGYGF